MAGMLELSSVRRTSTESAQVRPVDSLSVDIIFCVSGVVWCGVVDRINAAVLLECSLGCSLELMTADVIGCVGTTEIMLFLSEKTLHLL